MLAALLLRRREPKAPRPYRTPGWPLVPVGTLGLTVWMTIESIVRRPRESADRALTLVVGLTFMRPGVTRADLAGVVFLCQLAQRRLPGLPKLVLSVAISRTLHEVPVVLKTIGAVAGVLGVLLLLSLVSHGLRRVLDRPRIPMSRATYMVLGLLYVGMLAVAAVPLGVGRVLRDHARVDGRRTQVAEFRSAPRPRARCASPTLRSATGRSPSRSRAPAQLPAARRRRHPALAARAPGPGHAGAGRAGRRSDAPDGAPGWLLPVPDVAPTFPIALLVRQPDGSRCRPSPTPPPSTTWWPRRTGWRCTRPGRR